LSAAEVTHIKCKGNAMVRREDSITRFNSKTKKSILVIDDSADLLSLLKTIFEMEGYEVFTA